MLFFFELQSLTPTFLLSSIGISLFPPFLSNYSAFCFEVS